MVFILVPGRLVEPTDAPDASAPQVGGIPVFPTECNIVPGEAFRCPICHSVMKFIASDRQCTLYVFTCVNLDCNHNGRGSWRVFRWTGTVPAADSYVVERKEPKPLIGTEKGTENSEIDSNAEQKDQSGKTDMWGLGDSLEEEDAFDFAALEAELDRATSNISDHKKSENVSKNSHQSGHNTRRNGVACLLPGPCFPAFYLVFVDESASVDPSDVVLTAEQLQDVSHNEEEDTGDAGIVSWLGETYEPDTVITVAGREAPDTSFLKFMKCLSEVPDQCIRLIENENQAIWPLKPPPIFAHCSLCGAPSVIVAQIMSPVIAALEESLEYLEESTRKEAVTPPDAWNWATIGISVCSKLCMGADDGVYLYKEQIAPVGEA
eukprot:jgi/Picsp_1/4468/NSC_06689-R1_protein